MGAFVLAADMGEHTIPPIPIPFKAERGEALFLPNEPDVRRTCGAPLRDGEGEDPIITVGRKLVDRSSEGSVD